MDKTIIALVSLAALIMLYETAKHLIGYLKTSSILRKLREIQYPILREQEKDDIVAQSNRHTTSSETPWNIMRIGIRHNIQYQVLRKDRENAPGRARRFFDVIFAASAIHPDDVENLNLFFLDKSSFLRLALSKMNEKEWAYLLNLFESFDDKGCLDILIRLKKETEQTRNIQ